MLDFIEKVWFCGTVVDGQDHQAENLLPYLSICLILLASDPSLEDQFETAFGVLFKLTKSLFKDQIQIVNALMDNDERLFFVLTSLMRLSKKM